MNMNKDALEGMATVLRENGYKVSLKESDTKHPYINNRFNKISDLDLDDIAYDTCMFLKGEAVYDFGLHDYVTCSRDVTIGYVSYSYDEEEEEDFDEENIIKTDRKDTNGKSIVEKLSAYDYVIKLSDVLQLVATNEDFGV